MKGNGVFVLLCAALVCVYVFSLAGHGMASLVFLVIATVIAGILAFRRDH